MKKILLLALVVLASCECGKQEAYKTLVHPAKIKIDQINEAKYTMVYASFVYNDIVYKITNGNTGYYYKKYSLKPGDVIDYDVKLYFAHGKESDEIYFDNMDLTRYEIKK